MPPGCLIAAGDQACYSGVVSKSADGIGAVRGDYSGTSQTVRGELEKEKREREDGVEVRPLCNGTCVTGY